MNQDTYEYITKLVIDHLEGGYFHPKMYTQNPTKFKAYSKSGETLFGLDRHAGHGIYYKGPQLSKDVQTNLKNIESGVYEYKTPEAKEFWETIDKAGAKNNWPWLYKGGDQYEKLKDLAAKIMFGPYVTMAARYLSPEAKEIVESDPKLLIHFSYATWNGSVWFKNFADAINQAVAKGIKDKNELWKIAINSRLQSNNSLIKTSGQKIAGFIPKITFPASMTTSTEKKNNNNNLGPVVVGIVVASLVFMFLNMKPKA